MREDIAITWKDHEGSEKNSDNNTDEFGLHRIDFVGFFNNTSELSFELWITEGQNNVKKFGFTRDNYSLFSTVENTIHAFSWQGTEWYYESQFGTWVVAEQNYCGSATDGSKCFRAYYLPNSTANNLSGKNVAISFRASKTLGNHTETDVLDFTLLGGAQTSFELSDSASNSIVTGNRLEFDNITGTAVIFKRKTNLFSYDVTERLGSTQSFDNVAGSVQTINGLEAYPLGDNFKYGTWFVEKNESYTDDTHSDTYHKGNLQFLFRPNTEEINSIINSDENIISTLKFYVHDDGGTTNEIHSIEVTVTIDRTTVKPILSITNNTSSIVEGQPAFFTVTSNVDPMQPFYVSYIPTNSKGNFLDSTTFTSGFPQFEYLTFNQTVGSNDWTDEIEIDLREIDGVDAEDGSITVTLNTASEHAFYFAAAEPDNSATIMVKDAEYPTLSFAENVYTVTEEDTDLNAELTLNLSEVIEDTVNVSYVILDETATGGVDFVDIANGSVSFLPNTTSIPINFQIKGDDLSESDETFKIIISAPPSNAYFRHGVSTLEARVTIVDDEPIIMSVTTTDFNATEDLINGNFIVEVELTKTALIANPNTPIPEPVSFLVETSSGTATIDADFKTPDRQPTEPRFRIPVDAKTFSFAIPILNDVENEGNETFNVRIHDLQQATFADGRDERTFELTIIDNEKPTLSFMQDTITVEEEDAITNVELTMNLSGPIEEVVDISYEIIAESAIADIDFADNGNGIVTIAANTTSIPISIRIKNDDINEGDEIFKVRVKTPPDNAVFTDGVSMLEATIKIIDDESPTLSVDSSTLTISELAGMTHINLILSGPTNEDVVVTYSTLLSGSDTAQQADFTAQSASTITISPSPPSISGLIQIPIINDTDEEEDETFTLTLTEISGAEFANDQSSIVLQVTIIDDEGLPSLSIDSTEIFVYEQSGYAEIGLSFTPAITKPISIVYSTLQGTAVGGVDYTIQTNVRLEIATGSKEIIFIPVTNDNIFEGEEEFSLKFSAVSGAAYGSRVFNTPIMIILADDETEPTITISAYSCEYGETIPSNFTISESIGEFNSSMQN